MMLENRTKSLLNTPQTASNEKVHFMTKLNIHCKNKLQGNFFEKHTDEEMTNERYLLHISARPEVAYYIAFSKTSVSDICTSLDLSVTWL